MSKEEIIAALQHEPLPKTFSVAMHEMRRHLAVLSSSAETIRRFSTHPSCKTLAEAVLQAFTSLLQLTNEELGRVRKTVEATFPLPEWKEDEHAAAPPPRNIWQQPLDLVMQEILRQMQTTATHLQAKIQPLRTGCFARVPTHIRFIDDLLEHAINDFLTCVELVETYLIPRVREAFSRENEIGGVL